MSNTPFRAHIAIFFSFTHPPPTEIYTLSLHDALPISPARAQPALPARQARQAGAPAAPPGPVPGGRAAAAGRGRAEDRKSTRLNSSHLVISYAVFCLKKKKKIKKNTKLQ